MHLMNGLGRPLAMIDVKDLRRLHFNTDLLYFYRNLLRGSVAD